VQNWVAISNNEGAVRITIARWLTPKGRQIDRKGLTPDVYVQRTAADRQADRDPQLDVAVEVMQAVISGQAIPTSAPTLMPTPTPLP
jgi:carboxyl-terminal processing protease